MKTKRTLKNIALIACASLSLQLSAQTWTQLGSDINGEVAGDNLGRSVAISADGTLMAVGAPLNDANGTNAGKVRIYQWSANTNNWQQRGQDIDGEAANDESGRAVSLNADGSIVAIGAQKNDGNGINAGHVRVYEWNMNANNWQQKGLDIDGEATNDYSGGSLALSTDGTNLAIGSENNTSVITGSHVRIYEWSGTEWVQQGTNINGEMVDDNFGSSIPLSADGTIVAIGALYNDGNGSNSGHVVVYEWDTNMNSWQQKGSALNGEAASDFSGFAVSLNADGTIVAIGATGNDGNGFNAGHVRIYEWNTNMNNWQQKGLDINGEIALDRSGWSISLNADGNVVAIGAPYNSNGNGTEAGHVKLYNWDGNAWAQLGTNINGEATTNNSGRAVSLSNNNVLVVGARNDGNGAEAGHARVYHFINCTPATGTDTRTECSPYTWIDGNTYTANNNTTTFNIVGGADNGCDSLVTLNLTILNPTTGTDTKTECSPFVWIDAITYTANNNTATFNIVGGAANGCDSLVTLNLTILNPTTGTDTKTECSPFVWIDAITYTANNNTATFNIVGGAANGCDSLVTLNLTILNPTTGTDTQTACSSYKWIDGITYTANNNTATFNIVGGAANGCDSLVTLNLTILNPTTGTDTQTACSSYKWIDGITYTANNNTATFNIIGGAANGCDSTATLNLTINTVDNSVSQTGTTLMSNVSGATYQWIDCNNNNSNITGATSQSFTPTTSGSYAVKVTKNACTATSICKNVAVVGIVENSFGNRFVVYPNPIHENVSIELGQKYASITVQITDITGKVIQNKKFMNANKIELPINGTSGTYFVEITNDLGEKAVVKVVKE